MGQTLGLPDMRRVSLIEGGGTADFNGTNKSPPRMNSLDSMLLANLASGNNGSKHGVGGGLTPSKPTIKNDLIESLERDSEEPSESELLGGSAFQSSIMNIPLNDNKSGTPMKNLNKGSSSVRLQGAQSPPLDNILETFSNQDESQNETTQMRHL